jgi:hypothetical protein
MENIINPNNMLVVLNTDNTPLIFTAETLRINKIPTPRRRIKYNMMLSDIMKRKR